LTKNIILLESIDELPKTEFFQNYSKVIVFDYITHKKLNKKDIFHTFYDEYLSNNEINELFDFVKSCHTWNKNYSKLEFEGVNILEIVSPLEFHETFFPLIKKIYSIKKIIENENPTSIHVSRNLTHVVEQFLDKKFINELTIPIRSLDKGFNSEHIEIRFNIFTKPVTIFLSKKLFSRLKSIQENLVCKIFNLWYKPNKTQKINLILEFNPALFSSLFKEFKNSDHSTILFNQRRSAVWNWKSIQNLRENNCKIINPDDFFKTNTDKFRNICYKYESELKNFWESDEKLLKLFSKNNVQFWPEIKKNLIPLYNSRLENFLKSIIISKNILNELSLNSILLISESGENENILLQSNKNKVLTCLLQHSFFRYDDDLYDLQWRYESQAMYGLKSNYYFLWGDADYNFYSKYGIEKEKLIITGSPKHDEYFSIEKTTQEKTILLAIMPITNVSGLCRIQTYLDYELMLERILQILKNITNIKIIIKLHPGENFFNTLLNEYFKLKHPDILVLQTKPSKDLLESSDILIHTCPEFYEVSTIMLEAMLLGKPVIDVYLDDNVQNLKPIRDAILRISVNDDFNQIRKLITDDILISKMKNSISDRLVHYISNQHSASKKLVNFLDNSNTVSL